MFCVLMPGLLLPMLAYKMSRVGKKRAKKLSASPNLTPFYNKRLKSAGGKALSASALISDNTGMWCMSLPPLHLRHFFSQKVGEYSFARLREKQITGLGSLYGVVAEVNGGEIPWLPW